MAKRRRVTYVATLVYVDEPQLILFAAGKSKVIAVAIEDGERKYPFLATLVADADWSKYLRETVDLRYLFLYTRIRSNFIFDLADLNEESGSVMMDPWEGAVPEEYLPSPRFFARDHTEALPVDTIQVSEQRFNIDGNWDLPDFSHFYGKFSDLYAFQLSLQNFKNEAISFLVRRGVQDAFTKYPMRGGFSYVHFYDDLYRAQPRPERLGVERVAYASPGHVDVIGRGDIFTQIQTDLEHFRSQRNEIAEKYRIFYKMLSKAKLLTAAATELDARSALGQTVLAMSAELGKMVRLPDFDTLIQLCAGRPLAVAKVTLSYIRRLDETFDFFAEGRVQFGDRAADIKVDLAKPGI